MNDELKAIFKKKGLKQNDIAEAVGKSNTSISEYFNGKKPCHRRWRKRSPRC